MHKILWLDLETTGVDSEKDKIIEIGIIYQDLRTGKIAEFSRYIKLDSYPDNFNETEAIQVNGLTKEFLEKNGITEEEAYYDLIKFLNERLNRYDPSDKCILAGYNVTFDDDFSRALFERYGNKYYGSYISFLKIDVVNLIAQCTLLGIIPNLKNYKLETIIEYFKIKSESHKAIEDIRTTKILYELLSKKLRAINDRSGEVFKIIETLTGMSKQEIGLKIDKIISSDMEQVWNASLSILKSDFEEMGRSDGEVK